MTPHLLSMQDLALPSETLQNNLARLPLAQLPLLVMVGVTGVGKSTTLAALQVQLRGVFTLLPDRREITDVVMIAPQASAPVIDRQQRFELTARYRQAHPGGMAQALGELQLRDLPALPLVFDGLRGLDEVRYAAQAFPSWRFVGLHAPDLLRVRRLLGRADQFDTVAGQTGQMPLPAQLSSIEGVSEVFKPSQIAELAALQEAGYTAADIVSKTKIVVSERRHYDPAATRDFLLTLPSERFLDIDSASMTPAQVAQLLEAWL